jgi:single-strand selective monofunctional uracil DNA glycosylase
MQIRPTAASIQPADSKSSISEQLVQAARSLRLKVARLHFAAPVAYIYNPLEYAWEGHSAYLRRYGNSRKRVLFLGMNPGPFGMVQTGVPFGEVEAVRDWMGIETAIGRPAREHPKRPILGFACRRSEVSGRRLWGLFSSRFSSASDFFNEHFVVNYCPLAFLGETAANRTPDKLLKVEQKKLFSLCDEHLRAVAQILQPEWVLGIGKFAENCARRVFPGDSLRVGGLLHPSPASPAANRGWAEAASKTLKEAGIWR